MSERIYSQAMKNELHSLMELADARKAEKRLKEIFTVLHRWKRGRDSTQRALLEIHNLSASIQNTWSTGVDPGIPVAHAIVAGHLQKQDISDSTWKSIEILVALAKI